MKKPLLLAAVISLLCCFDTMAQNNKEITVGDVTFTMVFVEGGTFTMGQTPDQGAGYIEIARPAHKVTLDSFFIGQTEVTQELWVAVMGDNPSHFQNDPKCPVESVRFESCIAFIEKLNEKTGMTFRLPTESEWEFAARGGNKSKQFLYSGSDDLFEVGSYDEPMQSPNHPVGQKKANELGLFDMTGNVAEICSDYFSYWPKEFAVRPQTNPKGPGEKYVNGGRLMQGHVFRGGFCKDFAEPGLRICSRGELGFGVSKSFIGFRLAL